MTNKEVEVLDGGVLKEEVEEKVGLGTRIKNWCQEHPDVTLTLLGGFLSLIGGGLKIYANKTEYEDNLYTTLDDGQVYKLPAKKMKTCKKAYKKKK